MRPQLSRDLSLADHLTIGNALVGMVAILLAPTAPRVTAQLILFAAIFDGLDGLVARRYGSSDIGGYLDALADVVSFSLAPVVFVVALVFGAVGGDQSPLTVLVTEGVTAIPRTELVWLIATVGVTALYLRMALIRLAHYTVNDADAPYTTGVPTTLAASMLAAVYLIGSPSPVILLVFTGLLAYLMGTDLRYTDLAPRDALGMGALQFGAVVAPMQFNRLFPSLWLVCASLYLVLGPFFYSGRAGGDGSVVSHDPHK